MVRAGGPGSQRADVRLDDRGQHRRAGQAVGNVRGPADDSGQAVHGTQLRVGQRHPAEQAAQGHVRARLCVLPVGVGGAQGRARPAEPLAGQPVGQRRGPDRDERLQALRERVQAAGRRHGRRARPGQQRIDQRDPRDHQRAAQAGLEPVLRHGEHRVGGRLGPGARGGRDCDAGRRGPGDRPARPNHLQVVQRVTAVAEQHGHGLAGVDDAAAADRDDHVGSVLACGGDPGPGQFHRGLARDGKHRDG